MTTQVWFCGLCGTIGALRLADREDVMLVVVRMGDQHKKANPDCQRGTMGLQSIIPENISADCIIRFTQASQEQKQ